MLLKVAQNDLLLSSFSGLLFLSASCSVNTGVVLLHCYQLCTLLHNIDDKYIEKIIPLFYNFQYSKCLL